MLKKNEEYIVEIIDNGFQGEGISKIDGMAIFIPNGIKGEKVKIKILKVTSKIAYGKILEILEKSEYRNEADCETYSRCGGCMLRHVNYEKTLEIKKTSVETTLKKALGREIKISEVLKMNEPYNYRNKLQYPVGLDNNGNPVMGVFAERTHSIILTKECKIQDILSQKIANDIFDFIVKNNIKVYDEKSLTGSIRHIVIRIGKKTNEVMITLVTNTEKFEKEQELVNYITSKYQEIKTIVKNINNKNTNVILGSENKVLFGDGYIYDYLGDFKFKISPMSFYQVNPIQTEKLYSKAVEYAGLTGNETVFDLYCGIGTIGIFASKNVKKLYGIENVPEAIEDAWQNAKANNLENAEFFVGDVEKTLPEFIKERNITPDVVFVDPPRKGCDKTALDTLIQIKPKRIVYVSCNPATLARDLKILEEQYEIKDVSICDMFSFTHHVESVVKLDLREVVDE
ncbi:MAG: 23S rRNA (uracil(1939)-C(5))-methyltransferase RlmD [Clostridia bacterium]|nr:23S rRNA (uracil(1939)-C(5))-methyltransferase RlmD [Clostridia bacterium]